MMELVLGASSGATVTTHASPPISSPTGCRVPRCKLWRSPGPSLGWTVSIASSQQRWRRPLPTGPSWPL